MVLKAVGPDGAVEIARGLNFATAYALVEANDTEENPWYPGYEIWLTDGEENYVFETGCWVQV